MGQRFLRLLQDLVLPREQLQAEILPLALAHERLFVRRSVGLVLVDYSDAILLRGHCYPMPKTKRTPARGASLYRAARWGTTTELLPRAFSVRCKRRGRHSPFGARTLPVRRRRSRGPPVSASCIHRVAAAGITAGARPP